MEYRIKEVSDLVGLTPRTIRYYEKEGLLPAAVRTYSGYRTFSVEDIADLLRIKRLRSLGFALDEIRRIMDAPGSEEAMESLRELDARLKLLSAQVKSQRSAIAEIFKSGAPLDVVPQFAEWFDAREGKPYNDAEEVERDKMRLEMVEALGTETDRQRARDIMRRQAEASDDPLMVTLNDLDARFAQVDSSTPADDITELIDSYVEALTKLYNSMGSEPPSAQASSRSAQMYDGIQADIVRQVMAEVVRRLDGSV